MLTENVSDREFMSLALEEAGIALEENHVPVGAVIVWNNQVIARTRNQVEAMESSLAHAEMLALQSAQQFLFHHRGECTIYTTLEPCMMCLGAIVYAGFARLVVAALAPGVGALDLLKLSDYYGSRSPGIVAGVLEKESRDLILEYYHRTGLRGDLLGLPKG